MTVKRCIAMGITSLRLAKSMGEKYYFTGKACAKAGHIAEKYAGNGSCVVCRADSDKLRKEQARQANAQKKIELKIAHEKSLTIISREDAIRKKCKRYFTGETCQHGHIAELRVIDKRCVECHRINAMRSRHGLSKDKEEKSNTLSSKVEMPQLIIEGWPSSEMLAMIYTIKSHDDSILEKNGRFFTGIPCTNGHVDQRLTPNIRCVACDWRKRYGSDEPRIDHLYRAIYDASCNEPVLPDWPRITKEVAQAAGLKQFYEGLICKNGHVGPRYTGNNDCVLCSRQRNKYRYANDPDFRRMRITYEVERNRQPHLKEQRWADMREYNVRPEVRKRLLTRVKEDPLFKLGWNIRTLLRNTLKKHKHKKQSRLQTILGCSIEDFRLHIQRQFTQGMNWDNYGQWEIDHIVPLSSAKDGDGVIALFHHTNMRPLWRRDNRSKGAKASYLI